MWEQSRKISCSQTSRVIARLDVHVLCAPGTSSPFSSLLDPVNNRETALSSLILTKSDKTVASSSKVNIASITVGDHRIQADTRVRNLG